MCHLWWKQLKSICGILLSASQESNTEGERGRRGRQLCKAGLERSFQSKITHSALGPEGRKVCRHRKGNSAFSSFFSFGPSLHYMPSFWKLSIWKKPLLKLCFFFSTRLFLFFLFFFFFSIFFSSESRRWDNDQVKLVLCEVQVCREGKSICFLFPREACHLPLGFSCWQAPLATQGRQWTQKFYL